MLAVHAFFGFARPAWTCAGAGTAGPAAPCTGMPWDILLLMNLFVARD